MTQFFKKFPVITYNGIPAINMMARVNMSKIALKQKQAYFSYVIPEGERPDNLSYNYYNNSDYIWLIALTNQIIDPYYEFPLSYDNLSKYIAEKYGSIPASQNTILFFRNNWAGDDSDITVSAYNALPVDTTQNLKKYWAPTINQYNSVVSYVRKQESWIVTTNKIQGLEVNDSAGFIAGELLSQSGETVATLVNAEDNLLVVQHIAGSITTGTITGLTSNTSATISSVTTIAQNIPDSEMIYWSPVSAFDYEQELNNAKKNIVLLDNKYAGQAVKELKSLLAT